MFSLNSFFVSIVLIFSPYDNVVLDACYDKGRCDDFNVKVDAKIDEVIFKIDNAIHPIKYYVFDDGNELISEGKSVVKNLKNGSYEYMIVDGKGCWRKGKFRVTK